MLHQRLLYDSLDKQEEIGMSADFLFVAQTEVIPLTVIVSPWWLNMFYVKGGKEPLIQVLSKYFRKARAKPA